MGVSIQFIHGLQEETLPVVKLTKSKTGKTGTATFIFIQPSIFNSLNSSFITINGMYLLWDDKEIKTKDISIFFKDGKPFSMKVIFLFKNAFEWFNFLNFMNAYSKETGLYFEESGSSFE
jgi:photosystem II protein